MKANKEWNGELNYKSRKNYEKQNKNTKIKHEDYEAVIR